ncbi:gp53-like domain-containing protein [Pseudomonas chlororaphis]|uniref:gp53-like domain-containing protein n=1 Tax=Pseudomonas chlororaphis TaxID=587753 RepID=UPI00048D0CA1|nr:hypothetical protein [Pseudomonas chlororaphis]
MADLPELNEWPVGIYQLETSDPVLGGPEGIDNLQGKQLASRTKWLRDQLERIANGLTTVGQASKLATARALSFKGAATGSGSFDGSADIEIALALANSGVVAGSWPKVTVNSKGLVTGGSALAASDLPAVVTQPQFANDQSFSTTEFVQRALGNKAGVRIIEASVALTAAEAGFVILANIASNGVLTLPAFSTVRPGVSFYVQCGAATNAINVKAPDGMAFGAPLVGADPSSVTIQPGSAIEFIYLSASTILATNGAGVAQLATNGFQKHPSGLIFQWGVRTTSALSTTYTTDLVTFPITFPTGVLFRGGAFGTGAGANWLSYTLEATGTPRVSMNLRAASGSALPGQPFNWFAIGC